MDETTCQRPVRGAWARADDAGEAVRRLRHALPDSDHAALTLFFCAGGFDRIRLAAALREQFTGAPRIACTTAGEITPEGARDGSVTALQFDASHFRVAVGGIPDVHELGIDDATRLIEELRSDLDSAPPLPTACQRGAPTDLAILLVDGLSSGEEVLLANLTPGLGAIPLVGGSAANGQRLEHAGISVGGGFASGGAALALVRTTLPVVKFKTESFVLGEQRIVVTSATPKSRTVHEFNGRPAIEEYARMIGVAKDDLTPEIFAEHPVAIRVAGMVYVRSIRQPLPDGSLQFHCAMDEGLVLHDVHAIDLVNDTRRAFAQMRARLGEPTAVLAFDCIQRRLETERLGRVEELDRLFQDNHVVGFRTYGEQFGRTHINFTLSALAFGSPVASEGPP